MLAQDVISRIETEVSALQGRVRQAEDFRGILQTAGITSAQGGAYVMPLGMRGGKVHSATGAFVQDFEEVIAVVILVPTGGPGRQGETIFALIRSVIEALCGWVPSDAIGPFQLGRGAMINLGQGALAYQVEFSIPDQLRIAP